MQEHKKSFRRPSVAILVGCKSHNKNNMEEVFNFSLFERNVEEVKEEKTSNEYTINDTIKELMNFCIMIQARSEEQAIRDLSSDFKIWGGQ